MSVLTPTERQSLLKALRKLPLSEERAGRDLLLLDLPPALVASITRTANPYTDLAGIMQAVEPDRRSLLVLIDNALTFSRGSSIESLLLRLRDAVSHRSINLAPPRMGSSTQRARHSIKEEPHNLLELGDLVVQPSPRKNPIKEEPHNLLELLRIATVKMLESVLALVHRGSGA